MTPRLLIVNPNTNETVTGWLADEARRAVGERAEIVALNAPSGLTALETPAHVAHAAATVVETITARKDIAGALIAAFGDPGLIDARQSAPIPVAGLGEAGLRAAAAGGRRFAIVTLGNAMAGPIRARAEALGIREQLASLRILPVSIPELVARRSALLPMITEAVEASRIEDQADAVLLGGAPFAGLAQPLSSTLGLPVLDGVAAAIESLLVSP